MRQQQIAFSPHQIIQCNLSLMHMAKLKGLPTKFSFIKNDYEVDYTKVHTLFQWTDNETQILYLRWTFK